MAEQNDSWVLDLPIAPKSKADGEKLVAEGRRRHARPVGRRAGLGCGFR